MILHVGPPEFIRSASIAPLTCHASPSPRLTVKRVQRDRSAGVAWHWG